DVAIMAILKALCEFKSTRSVVPKNKKEQFGTLIEDGIIVYVVPMKALATEITHKLKNKLHDFDALDLETILGRGNKKDYRKDGGCTCCSGNDNNCHEADSKLPPVIISEYTGDTELTAREIKDSDIIVCTPEKLDVATRKAGNILEKRIKLIIIDEIHIIQDERGPVIEALVTRILRIGEIRQEFIRIIGLSATLPNHYDVGNFIRADKVFRFEDEYRAVPLAVTLIGAEYSQFKNIVVEKIRQQNMKYERENKGDLYKDESGDNKFHESTLIFVNSRSETLKFARILYEEFISKEQKIEGNKKGEWDKKNNTNKNNN
ncbi:Activating signal cointegrator 1 complex subunit 3, partial [Dictyocoela roeselum]